ncbi:MAG TPA: IPT/TIG domain-containing protein [Bryobacteraceae bacterium]|nr:IPT/TIG domain-containing protein [Bryobacteraceae bacterium]
MLRSMMGAAALVACGLSTLQAGSTLVLSADGITVYDTVNNISWLADANLPATNRFGLPVCSTSGLQPCVNPSGSMSYQSAAAWVSAMNATNYLGHTNWQLPTTPTTDKGCGKTGPQNNSFGFDCSLGALGSLYYNAWGLKPPNTAVPIPHNTAGPFSNFQPYLYWSQSPGQGGNATLSFNSGFQGANTVDNFLYTLPMIPGKISGTPPATGNGLEVNPGGQTVYDPVTNVTWLADANLAATSTFGLPPCNNPTSPALCVNQDGAMTLASANQFIANMNSYNGSGYLGQTSWELPPIDQSCTGYKCADAGNPMAELFYDQLGLSAGTPVAATPDVAAGPFHNIQPYLYWTCGAAMITDPCGTPPAPGFEWSFSFGNGFLGTDILMNDLYVTAYFVGNRISASGPVIAEVANAEGESPAIAPNTWVEIKGVNLAPSGDSRIWQGSDFMGTQMPTELDQVSATVNGKNAYVYYISPTQINVLTPPDAMNGAVQVVVTNNGAATGAFTAQAQPLSPSFFVFNGGPYAAATHVNGTFLGPASLYAGVTTPAQPGETVVLYGNGFGPTSTPVVSGSTAQTGSLSPLPVIKIGGIAATVQFAGLVAAGQYQFNVVVPSNLANGDQSITATYGGQTTQAGTLITVQN